MAWVSELPGPKGYPQVGWPGSQDLAGRQRAGLLGTMETCRGLLCSGRSQDVALGQIVPVDWLWEMWPSLWSPASNIFIPITLQAKGSTTKP